MESKGYDVEICHIEGLSSLRQEKRAAFRGTGLEFALGQLYGQIEGFLSAHLIHPIAAATLLTAIDDCPDLRPFYLAESRAIYAELACLALAQFQAQKATKQ